MPDPNLNAGNFTRDFTPLNEIDILWITAGLGCDGESIAMTAATQPSVEDLVLGAIPGIPKIKLHNPVFAYANGDEFLKSFYLGAAGKLDPFILIRRLDPQRRDQSANGVLPKSEGYFLMQTIRGRASLNLYLCYRGRHIEQTAQIL